LCLNEAYSKVLIGKSTSDNFPIQNVLEEEMLYCFSAFQLCFRICHLEGPRKPGGTEIKWGTSGAVYADDGNLMGDNIDTTKENRETLIDASKKVGLEVNTEKNKCMLLSRPQNAGQNQDKRWLRNPLKM
jgi:hypothetical protein